MAEKPWNELQDEGPHEVRVKRKDPYAMRSEVARLTGRVAGLERTVEREQKSARHVRIVVLILAIPLVLGFIAALLNLAADMRG